MTKTRSAAIVLFCSAAMAAGAVPRGQVPDPPTRDLSPARTPVLVELFTAEGCSSCPPADRLLEAMIASQPTPAVEIVGLGEHVDYWNALGWKDRFSSAAFTQRQQVYANRLAIGDIYTPQMVVDGVAGFVGTDVASARAAIEKAASSPHGRLQVDLSAGSANELDISVTIASLPAIGSADHADVVIALIEDGLRSDVKRGENAGKVLTHAAVTRVMTTIGEAGVSGGSVRSRVKVAPDWKRERLRVVAFVQERQSRRVLATAAVAATKTSNPKPEAR